MYTTRDDVEPNMKDSIRRSKEECKLDHKDWRLFLTAEIREGFMKIEPSQLSLTELVCILKFNSIYSFYE